MSETKKLYWQKLQDPRWQRKRLEVLQRDSFRCMDCGAEDKMLQVHHAYYVSGREPWQYPNGAYETLCKDCHEERRRPSDELAVEQEWETYKGIEDESSRSGACATGFTVSVLRFSSQHQQPACEVLRLLSEAMDWDVIDKEDLIRWRADIKRIQEKARRAA